MKKYEFDENLKVLYKSQKKEPFFVNVPSMNYITYIGEGHPDGNDFQMACNALYTLSYIIKFKIIRDKLGIDYKVNPMEVDWLLDKSTGKTSYAWTMMIMQPDFVTKEMFEEAVKIVKKTKKDVNLDKAVFEKKEYGKCIQCFHLGDYNKMNDTFSKMVEYGKLNGFKTEPFTHDTYLNDTRKTKKENYKTIIRLKVIEEK